MVNQQFLQQWHELVAKKDLDALANILAEDISIGAPPYWDNLSGHALVAKLLEFIITTIDDFTYQRQWHDDASGAGEIALEFTGKIDGLDLQGIDLISLNTDGKIQHLDVLIRPLNALEKLRDAIGPKMMAYLNQQ